jgi:hypothetical protein
MINNFEKTLKKWHRFAPYKQHQRLIKTWRNSWLHKNTIVSNKPNHLDIAHAKMLDLALKQKDEFQKASEAIRFDFFDIWQDMEYSQRNAFLLQYLDEKMASFISFEYQDERIVIPFFDALLNALIIKRPAVFDLPQYFKLYKEFKDNVVNPMKTYGLALLTSDFYPFLLCASQDEVHVFYDKEHHVLFVISNNVLTHSYPLYGPCEDEALCHRCAQLIIQNHMIEFIEVGCEHQLFHPKLIKKLRKALPKLKKGKS